MSCNVPAFGLSRPFPPVEKVILYLLWGAPAASWEPHATICRDASSLQPRIPLLLGCGMLKVPRGLLFVLSNNKVVGLPRVPRK